MDAPAEPRGFEYAATQNIARAVIAANWRLADATRADGAALVHDLVVEVWRANNNNPFDPLRGVKYLTWAGGIMHRRLIDMVRRRARVERLERQVGGGGEWGGCGGEEEGRRGGEELEQMRVANESRTAVFFDSPCPEIVLRIPNRIASSRHGRIGHPPRAYASALAFREAKALSWAGLMRALEEPAVREQFGFRSRPARSKVIDSKRRLWLWHRRMKPA